MKASRKILFIKNRPDAAFARSWIVDDLGMHSRIIADAALLGRILTGEVFDLVLLDQRGSNEELIPSIEGMRQYQPNAKLVIVSDGVALSEVQQAMRFNVHDIFLPPFELLPIVERVDAMLAKVAMTAATPAAKLLGRWSELVATLEGKLDALFTQNDTSVGTAGTDPAAPAGPLPEDLQKQLDAQKAELEALRAQLAEATEARARLNDQVAHLSAGASALGRAEARARALEAEVIELRKNVVDGPGGADIANVREELERAKERIFELDRLNQGLLAGAPSAASPELEARVSELEAELAEANARFEAAGQAFATEIEQVMAREAEAMAALAAAEDRERKAQAVMASAGDAFGRADETIERERAAIQAEREAVEAEKAAVAAERTALDARARQIDTRTRRVDTTSASFASDVEGALIAMGSAMEQMQAVLLRREEVKQALKD